MPDERGLSSPPLIATGELVEQARDFAGDLSDLLNRTVTNGVRLSAVLTPAGRCIVGYGITKHQVGTRTVPLTIDNRTATCYFLVTHVMGLDPEETYLTDVRSSYGAYRDEVGEKPLFRYDYIRNNVHHPEAHFHLEAEFDHGSPHGVRHPKRLHMPVGGRRFRPAVEDVVECLVREGFARGRPGWEDAVAEHRAKWYERQLRAAVRRDPDVALSILREMGAV